MTIAKTLLASALLLACSSAFAAKGAADPQKFFFGAGLSQNDVPGSDEGTGYQFFGGYEFGEIASGIALDAEVGYMNTGDMDVRVGPVTVETRAKGIWAAGVARILMSSEFELLGRAGLDFGDDDGLLVGIGAGFNLNKQTTLRFELVERDDVSSLQFNVLYRL